MNHFYNVFKEHFILFVLLWRLVFLKTYHFYTVENGEKNKFEKVINVILIWYIIWWGSYQFLSSGQCSIKGLELMIKNQI